LEREPFDLPAASAVVGCKRLSGEHVGDPALSRANGRDQVIDDFIRPQGTEVAVQQRRALARMRNCGKSVSTFAVVSGRRMDDELTCSVSLRSGAAPQKSTLALFVAGPQHVRPKIKRLF